MQCFLECRAAGELLERPPIFRTGLLFFVVRGGGVDPFADVRQIQDLAWANVLALFYLDQAAVVLRVVLHCRY